MKTCTHFRIGASLTAWLFLTLVGCSGDSSVGSVRGTVTLDGRPIENATITYTPKEGGSPSHARTDAEGYYELRYTRSLAGAEVGEHQVSISTYAAANPDSEPPTDVRPELIPAEYNLQSRLVAHVKSGRNQLDFPLESRSAIIQPGQWQTSAQGSNQRLRR